MLSCRQLTDALFRIPRSAWRKADTWQRRALHEAKPRIDDTKIQVLAEHGHATSTAAIKQNPGRSPAADMPAVAASTHNAAPLRHMCMVPMPPCFTPHALGAAAIDSASCPMTGAPVQSWLVHHGQPARAQASPAATTVAEPAAATTQQRAAQTQAVPGMDAGAAPHALFAAPGSQSGAGTSTSTHDEPLQVLGAAKYRSKMKVMNDAVNAFVGRIEQDAPAPKDSDQQVALSDVFSNFDGEAILFETGVLRRLQPQALQQLRSLSPTFIARAENHDFDVRQCINILSTMTLLGEPDIPLHDTIVRRCIPELPKTDPENVGSLCYILGINGYSSRSFLQALESLLLQRHARFSPRALAKAVWMLGRVQYNNEDISGLVDEVVRRCMSDEAEPTDLVYGLWATGIHEEVPEALVDRTLETLPDRVRELTGGELAKLAWGLVQQDVGTTGLFDKIADAAVESLGEMYPRDIAKLAWVLGQRNAGAEVLARPLASKIEQHLQGFTRAELDMLISAYNQWGLHDGTVEMVSRQLREGMPL